jgi:hypothetical protein
MEQSNNQPWQDSYYAPSQPAPQQPIPQQTAPVQPNIPNQPFPPRPVWQPRPVYATGRKEHIFGLILALCCVLLADFILCGGFSLGFAIGSIAAILCTVIYLLSTGHRMNWYSGSLIFLSLAIAAGFGRSADGFVKYIMLQFMMIALNLALCIMAGQNRRTPGGISSLLDSYRTILILPFSGIAPAARGLRESGKTAGTAGKKGGALIIGLLLSLPIIAMVIGLLASADAAFEGMLTKLPEIKLSEIINALFFGIVIALYLYARGISLHRAPSPKPLRESRFKGFSAVTINTVLCALSGVYVLYLVSQLAYISGGFSGILPEEFTMAEYARRGFFEMALLCGINLSIISLAVALVEKKQHTPIFTRILCLFIGLVTAFLVASASAKMFMYIGSYGLTRYRVLTEVIMIWLGISTLVVCLWVFFHKLPYMKVILLLALAMGAVTFWVDVDTQVAKYNVAAYQSGKLENVDVEHLTTLGPGAARYIALLENDPDPIIADQAKNYLYNRKYAVEDFRDWNAAKADGASICTACRQAEISRIFTPIRESLDFDFSQCELVRPDLCTKLADKNQAHYRISLTAKQADALEKAMESSSQWQALPLTGALDTIFYGKGSVHPHFRFDTSINILPRISNGYCFFLDNHPEATDPTDANAALARDTYNFVIAVYNADTQFFYYFTMDTVNAAAQ